MAKILFSDLDGTLLAKGGAISDKNFEAMKKMQEQGHYIALCTGRNHIDIQPILNKIHIPYDYLVLCNGSYIEDKNGNILFEEHISKEVGEAVIQQVLSHPDMIASFCFDEGCPILVNGETKVLYLDGLKDSEDDFYTLLKKAERFYMLSFHHKNVSFNQDGSSIEAVKEVANEITERFSEVETHLNQEFVDVAPRGHSKGTGVKKLISLLDNIDRSYAIGDSFNDLPMIRVADVGVTFDYAVPEIQEEADKVVHYVYELIEEEILS